MLQLGQEEKNQFCIVLSSESLWRKNKAGDVGCARMFIHLLRGQCEIQSFTEA